MHTRITAGLLSVVYKTLYFPSPATPAIPQAPWAPAALGSLLDPTQTKPVGCNAALRRALTSLSFWKTSFHLQTQLKP